MLLVADRADVGEDGLSDQGTQHLGWEHGSGDNRTVLTGEGVVRGHPTPMSNPSENTVQFTIAMLVPESELELEVETVRQLSFVVVPLSHNSSQQTMSGIGMSVRKLGCPIEIVCLRGVQSAHEKVRQLNRG